MNPDEEIGQLAAAQHGVLALGQLRDLGLSARTVQLRAASGRLHRIRRGVYALAPAPLLSLEGHWLAAVLACGPGAALSHRSAAALHELRRTSRRGIDVTVRGGSHRRHTGIDLHRSTTLAPSDVTVVSSIPCTTVARTLLDLAEVIRRRQLERTLDQAAAIEVLDLWALDEQLQRNPRRAAAARLGAAIEQHSLGRTPTWSKLEEAFLNLTRSVGLSDPEVNRFIVLPDGEPAIRADFTWLERRLVVETDGWETHKTRASFERDRHNDLRLTAFGFRAVRTTWRAIMCKPEPLIARIVAVYNA